MNDHELDGLLRRAQPESAIRVPAVAPMLHEAGQELLEEIMSVELKSDRVGGVSEATSLSSRWGQPRSRGRRWLAGVAVAAAVVAAVVMPTVVFHDAGAATPAVSPSLPPSASPSPQPSAPTGTGNPYLLLDGPGWKVDYVIQTASADGEIQFRQKSTDVGLDISWVPIAGYQDRYEDRRSEHEPKNFTFLGRKAVLFGQGDDGFEVLAKRGDVFLDVRSSGTGSRPEFDALVRQLKQVTAEQWFAAMPKSVVTPSETTAIAAQMLKDVPLPDGFDASIFTSAFTNEYDQFGFRVVAKVTCAWLADYAQARTAHDEAGMAAADAALSSSKNWRVVQRLGAPDPIGAEPFIKAVSHRKIVADYESGLGCDY